MENNWEIEFDKKCLEWLGGSGPLNTFEAWQSYQTMVKTFLSSLLQQQRQRMAEKIELEVEKWKPAYDDLQGAHIDGLQAALNIVLGERENHD